METGVAESLPNQPNAQPNVWKEYGSRIAAVVIAATLLLSALFGSFYSVDKTEEATIRRFGAYIETVGSGFHLKLPFVDAVRKTDVTTIHRLEIGFRTEVITKSEPTYKSIPEESEMLTGDENIALVDFVVQYRSADAYKWQYVAKDPEKVLGLMAQAAMRLVVGRSSFDQMATTGKVAAQTEAMQVLQRYIDTLDFGAQLVSVQLQDVQPPQKVLAAFKDVVNAREEKDSTVQIAHKHANQVLPDARGQVARIKNDAEAYAQARIAAAEGDVAKFEALLVKYEQAPEVTAQRLLFETQERVLHGKNVIVDPGSGNNLLKLFQINPPSSN